MTIARISRVALLVVFTGCRPDIPVADVAAGISPLSELTGVRIGMRADELIRVRPAAQVAGYYGFEEAVRPWRIAYEVPGSVDDHQAPPDGAHLRSVIASDSVAETPDPLLQWQAQVRAVSGVTRTNPTCYQLHWPTTTAWMAVWSRGGGELFVLGQPASKDPAGTMTPPGLRIGVVRSGQAVAHAYSPARRIDCRRVADVDSSSSRSTLQ